MSLHAQCHWRIARTTAHRTVWRRRCIRHYVSSTASDDEWFQQLRDKLLRRTPYYHREDLDLLHHEQLQTTLLGVVPDYAKPDAEPIPNISLAELLTRCNVRVPSHSLLNDGTDHLHHPGKPWMRRMWAGGAVKVNPELTARSEVPFRLKQTVACLERIKDVQLRGEGDQAKIYVNIERRFALRDSDQADSVSVPSSANRFNLAGVNEDDWGDSSVKEKRSLVFMRAKTAAELEQPEDTRYLRTPGNPVYSFPLTPTPSLLFRYSALTYNAHLIHLDSAYARSVEGHRSTLVHGPLTLTLMLQVLNKHLGLRQIAQGPQSVQSIEYRNFAPLYCNEEMRICVKHKEETSTGNTWEIWIEGPTSLMAVKAVAHTTFRSTGAICASRAMGSLPEAASPNLPAKTMHQRTHGEKKSTALANHDSSPSQVSGESRRKSRREYEAEQDARAGFLPFSRRWRKAWIGVYMRYLYLDSMSPLINTNEVLRVRKIDGVTIRKTDVGLQETARRRASERRARVRGGALGAPERRGGE